jgi:hypothetical protein
MHRGQLYPYLREFWQAELNFWPGFVPRKVHLSCPAGYGTSWDRLVGGVVTEVGVPDAFSVGDPGWFYIDPGSLWEVQLLIHKTANTPKQYTWAVRVQETGVVTASLTFGEQAAPSYVFSEPVWVSTSHFPPYSLGVTVPIAIRPATWTEV